MGGYVVRRLGRVAFMVFAVSLIVFFLMHLSGDPTQLMLPMDATPEARAALREAYGLDNPLAVQYVQFLVNAVQGDFGRSLQHRRPALDLVLERYPNTFQLALASVGLGLVVGLPLGILAAARRGGTWNKVALVVSMVGQSVPVFWLGMMLILVFAVSLRWLSTSGKSGLDSFILPSITLALGFAAQVILLVRSSMLEVLGYDYIRTAHAKGLVERAVIFKHAFRNTLIPLVTFVGMAFGTLLGGAVITETVFSWPGVGLLAVNAIFARDFPLVQASVFTLSLGIALINLLVDLCYGFLDPRMRRT